MRIDIINRHIINTCLILFTVFYCKIGFAQQTSEVIQAYPYTRKVQNQYNSKIIGELYLKSVYAADSLKTVAKNLLTKGIDLEKMLKTYPNYLNRIDSMLNCPSEINRIYPQFGISVKIYGVDMMVFDTLAIKNWSLTLLEDEKNNRSKNTIIGYNFGDFIGYPKLSPFMLSIGYEFIHQKLDDGLYTMYYEPIFDRESNTFTNEQPYCIFELKNHQMNGKAVYFSPHNDTVAQGNFINNKQNGLWIINLPYSNFTPYYTQYGHMKFSSSIIDTTTNWCRYEIEYLNGELNGCFNYFENKKCLTKGIFIHNKPIGKWETYHTNGRLANRFFLLEKTVRQNKKQIIPLIPNNYSLTNGVVKNDLPLGNLGVQIRGFNYELLYCYIASPEKDNYLAGDVELNLYEDVNKKYYTIQYTGNFEAYHENGSKYFQLELDSKNRIISFSNVFDSSGNILQKWDFNKKQTKAIVEYYNYYPNKGTVKFRVSKKGFEEISD